MATLQELLAEKLGTDVDLSNFLSAAQSEADALVDSKITGLTTNKTKLLDQINKLKKNQMPDNVDMDAYNTFLTEKDELETQKAKAKEDALAAAGEWDTLKGSMTDAHSVEITTLTNDYTTKLTGLQSALDKELIENVAVKAIDKEHGNATLLLPHIKPNLKTVKSEAGDYTTQVVDAEGNQRINSTNGEVFTINDLVAELKANETFSGAFPMQNSGSGIPPNSGGKGGNQVNPWKADTKNITLQAKLTRTNPVLAAQMQKSAGITT